MECCYCGRENDIEAKYCKYCGKEVLKGSARLGSVDRYFFNKENQCQSCGKLRKVKYVAFYQNIGYLFGREYRHIKGKFCKQCIDDYFWKFTGRTLLFGWWGMISFIITPFYLINNIGRYVMTLGMNRYE